MEYIKGQDLWQRIQRGKNPLPEAEATRYITKQSTRFPTASQ